jgi:DNA-binding response OmpR family regulator
MALVLVVDDAPQIRRLVRFTVEHKGHRVLEAADGADGWRLMVDERPDLVILDVMMAGASGLDICREIRAHPAFNAIPVIVMTAGGPAATRDAALAAGASGYVSKPFRPSTLLDMVESFAGR